MKHLHLCIALSAMGCESPSGTAGTGPFFDDGETPFLIRSRMDCQYDGQYDEKWVWEVQADDSQGTVTLREVNEISIHSPINEVYRHPIIACSDAGHCVGSIHSRLTGIRCERQEDYEFRAHIYDDDGNVYEGGFPVPWDGTFIE